LQQGLIMAMNLTELLGFGAARPLVDMGDDDDDEVGAAARTSDASPAPGSPPDNAATEPPQSRSFLEAILGVAPEGARDFRRSLADGLSTAAQNYNKPASAAAAAGFAGALGGRPQSFKLAALDRAIRARQAGDMDELKRALMDLRRAQRLPLTAGYGDATSGTMAPSLAAAPTMPQPPIRIAPATLLPDNSDFRTRYLARARDAIAQGADRNAVMQRLRELGIDPSGL
jgi:hypothetical protein